MGIYYINNEKDTEVRWDESLFMQYIEDGYDIMSSKIFITDYLHSLPPEGSFTITTEEYRPELISYRIYGDTQFWWILMEYNNITDISELINGKVIEYPSMNDLETMYFELKTAKG